VAAALFHVCNHFWFDIGVFPFLAMGASLIFCKPDWPRRFTALLRRMTGWQGAGAVEGAAAKPGSERAAPGTSRSENGPPPVGGLVTVGLVSWLAVQLLLPLRHWLYPGNVDWTEEGHRFSWQMMLRDKGYELRGFRVQRPEISTNADSDVSGGVAPDGGWRLQPVADPLPPLYPLPLPLQAACDPEWAATIEESSLDQLMMERLSPREQAMLGLDPGTYAAMQEAKDGETVRLVAELDRALTHRALWGILQHARRLSESESSDSESKPGDAAPARLLTNLHRVARDVFEEVDLEVPDHQIEQLLVGAEEFDRMRLAGYQAGPMLTRPYMLRQYAHHVADRLERVWGVRPHVSVDLEVSLNMRPFEPIVDPGLDLASLPFSLRHAEWIEPLAAPLPSFEERRARRLQLEESGYFIE